MVQTDISQLSRECNSWRETLRSYRDQFNHSQKRLQQAANHPLPADALQNVEHYQNQFHIQLINIHDLKQAIKSHDRKLNFELAGNGHVSEETLTEHEHLYNEYISLEQTLQELSSGFNNFLAQSN